MNRAFAFAALLVLGLARSAGAVTYTKVDLGTLPGYAYSLAADINDNGQVVGICYNREDVGPYMGPYCWVNPRLYGGCSSAAAFVWENGTMTKLDIPGGCNAVYARAINNHGQIVGYSQDHTGIVRLDDAHAWTWKQETNWSAELLPHTHVGDEQSRFLTYAYDINDQGLIVGEDSFLPAGGGNAVTWQNGVESALGYGVEWGAANYVNDSGTIVGHGDANPDPNQVDHRWFYLKSGVRTWGRGYNPSEYIFDINDAENCQFAGSVGNYPGVGTVGSVHALSISGSDVWVEPNAVYDRMGTALGINDSGDVVGKINSIWTWGLCQAYVWHADGTTSDLGSGGAAAINSRGWVVGQTKVGGQWGAWSTAALWIPVPEPSSLLALAGGIGCFAAILRRRRQ